MRTLVPARAVLPGISGGSLGVFYFYFFFFLYFRIPAAGVFGLNRRWATRYIPRPDEECDVIAGSSPQWRPLNGNMSHRVKGILLRRLSRRINAVWSSTTYTFQPTQNHTSSNSHASGYSYSFA